MEQNNVSHFETNTAMFQEEENHSAGLSKTANQVIRTIRFAAANISFSDLNTIKHPQCNTAIRRVVRFALPGEYRSQSA